MIDNLVETWLLNTLPIVNLPYLNKSLCHKLYIPEYIFFMSSEFPTSCKLIFECRTWKLLLPYLLFHSEIFRQCVCEMRVCVVGCPTHMSQTS